MNRASLPLAILPLIAGSALVALAVGGSEESVEDFEQRISPDTHIAEPPPEPELDARQETLQNDLIALGEGFDGDLGIAVTHAGTMATMAYNGDARMPQQSVTKLWVALAAMDAVDKGELDLSEPVTIGRTDLTLFHQPIREIVKARGVYRTTYEDLIQRAITRSDNTANDRLLRRLGGPQAAADFLADNRIEGVTFGEDERTKQSAIAGLEWRQSFSIDKAFYEARDRVPDDRRRTAFEAYLANPSDGATAHGIAQALARLSRGALLGEQSTDYILGVLQETRSGPRRLKGGVPLGWTFGHKTGTGQIYDGVQAGYNDIGILTAPDGTNYAIAVLIGQTRAAYRDRMAMMQEVTRSVVRYHEGRAVSFPEAETIS